jgi:hypothetical protein
MAPFRKVRVAVGEYILQREKSARNLRAGNIVFFNKFLLFRILLLS